MNPNMIMLAIIDQWPSLATRTTRGTAVYAILNKNQIIIITAIQMKPILPETKSSIGSRYWNLISNFYIKGKRRVQ